MLAIPKKNIPGSQNAKFICVRSNVRYLLLKTSQHLDPFVQRISEAHHTTSRGRVFLRTALPHVRPSEI
jgi:hypothetical protein